MNTQRYGYTPELVSTPDNPFTTVAKRFVPAWTRSGAWAYYGEYRVRSINCGRQYLVQRRNSGGRGVHGFLDQMRFRSYAQAREFVVGAVALEFHDEWS